MKKKKLLLCSFVALLGLSSCIQDEPLNPEADILNFSLPQGIAISEPVFNENNIFISIPKGENVNSIAPEIKITEGAVISPASGVVQDFSSPVEYTVTSQSGKYQRKYKVTLDPYMFYQTDFDHWEVYTSSSGQDRYETPVEYSDNGSKIPIWSSSNKGVAIYQHFLDPNLYPVHSTSSPTGSAVMLETRKGPGNIMNIQYIPIVAGSLFTGTMNIANAIEDPLSATQFGIACDYMPDRITGNYNYKAGSGEYINSKGEVISGKIDQCALYAVFFKVDEKTQVLDGNNVLTHPNIVAITEQPFRDSTPGNGLVAFDIPFIYKEGVTVDFQKNKYKIAIIFSSSSKGDSYEGTPGSKMIVDNVRVTTKNE